MYAGVRLFSNCVNKWNLCIDFLLCTKVFELILERHVCRAVEAQILSKIPVNEYLRRNSIRCKRICHFENLFPVDNIKYSTWTKCRSCLSTTTTISTLHITKRIRYWLIKGKTFFTICVDVIRQKSYFELHLCFITYQK